MKNNYSVEGLISGHLGYSKEEEQFIGATDYPIGVPAEEWEKEFDFRTEYDYEDSSTPEVSFLDLDFMYPDSEYEWDIDKIKEFIRHHMNLKDRKHEEKIDELKNKITELENTINDYRKFFADSVKAEEKLVQVPGEIPMMSGNFFKIK